VCRKAAKVKEVAWFLRYYISRESKTTKNVLWSRASVCLSVRGRMPTVLHGPGCTWGSGRGCPLVVHYWTDLQSVHRARDALLWQHYGNGNAWQSPAVIRQAQRTPHALRTHARIAPAIKSTRLLRVRRYLQRGRSVSSILRGCCNANAKC